MSLTNVSPPDSVFKDYLKYIKQLPLNDSPELFGLHENANMTYAQNETFAILDKFLLMQAKTGGGGGKSQEEVCQLFWRRWQFWKMYLSCSRNESKTFTIQSFS